MGESSKKRPTLVLLMHKRFNINLKIVQQYEKL